MRSKGSVPRTCEQCGAAFSAQPQVLRNGHGRFCSRACGWANMRQRLDRQCETCGAPFTATPRDVAQGRGRFCSLVCCGVAKRARLTRRCQRCGTAFTVQPARVRAWGGRFCSHACAARLPEHDRFWSNVAIGDPDGCWLWRGGTTRSGYGRLRANGRSTGAHRLSYEWFVGPIPEGYFVCHRCDVPECVNPEHLFLGSPLDNTRDMDAKGRRRVAPRAGTRNHNARLTEQIVRVARERHVAGVSLHALAREYGVSVQAIWLAVRRTTWKHVP